MLYYTCAKLTFPQSTGPLSDGDGTISLYGRGVSCRLASSSQLSLEPDLNHICRLSYQHGKATGCTTCSYSQWDVQSDVCCLAYIKLYLSISTGVANEGACKKFYG